MIDDRLAECLDVTRQPGATDEHRQLRDAIRRFVDRELAPQVDRGKTPTAQVALAKNRAARVMRRCADDAVQILGGAGYMRGTRMERIYREVKVMMIGGGAEEILVELAVRQPGVRP